MSLPRGATTLLPLSLVKQELIGVETLGFGVDYGWEAGGGGRRGHRLSTTGVENSALGSESEADAGVELARRVAGDRMVSVLTIIWAGDWRRGRDTEAAQLISPPPFAARLHDDDHDVIVDTGRTTGGADGDLDIDFALGEWQLPDSTQPDLVSVSFPFSLSPSPATSTSTLDSLPRHLKQERRAANR